MDVDSMFNFHSFGLLDKRFISNLEYSEDGKKVFISLKIAKDYLTKKALNDIKEKGFVIGPGKCFEEFLGKTTLNGHFETLDIRKEDSKNITLYGASEIYHEPHNYHVGKCRVYDDFYEEMDFTEKKQYNESK